MRRVILLLVLVIALQTSAFATWSVIAVDRSTGRVVISSATCTGNTDDFLKDVQAVVVPGFGVAACQAGVDGTHQNQTLVFQELQKGTDPKRIIEMLSQDPGFQGRQYGILDLQGRQAGHSGLTNGYVTQNISGQVPGTEIFYAVQGNTIKAGAIAKAAAAFVTAKGAITDRVMAALEAGDANGGDVRCACPKPPEDGSKPPIPCDNLTAYVSFIVMAEPTDTNGDSHNDGKYALYLRVSQPNATRPHAVKVGESLNPVKTLRMRYDVWRKAQPVTFK